MSAAIRLPSRKEFALTAPAFLFGVRLWTSVCLALFIDAFNLAVTRATEICMGIVSAGLVLAGTDFGGARHRLATQRQALRMTCLAGAEALVAFPADTASQPDWTAEAFLGLEYALNGQALLEVPRQSSPSPGRLHLRLPDLLPCFVSALRVFVTFAAIELSAGIIGPGNGIGLKTAEFHRVHPWLSPHWSASSALDYIKARYSIFNYSTMRFRWCVPCKEDRSAKCGRGVNKYSGENSMSYSTPSGTGQTPGTAGQRETLTMIAASKVNGTKVYNNAGEALGSIYDLMLDKHSGQVNYAIMSFGGFLGIGEKYHPLPWGELTYSTANDGYVVNLDKRTLENAPSFGTADVPDWSSPTYRTGIDEYYHARH